MDNNLSTSYQCNLKLTVGFLLKQVPKNERKNFEFLAAKKGHGKAQ